MTRLSPFLFPSRHVSDQAVTQMLLGLRWVSYAHTLHQHKEVEDLQALRGAK